MNQGCERRDALLTQTLVVFQAHLSRAWDVFDDFNHAIVRVKRVISAGLDDFDAAAQHVPVCE